MSRGFTEPSCPRPGSPTSRGRVRRHSGTPSLRATRGSCLVAPSATPRGGSEPGPRGSLGLGQSMGRGEPRMAPEDGRRLCSNAVPCAHYSHFGATLGSVLLFFHRHLKFLSTRRLRSYRRASRAQALLSSGSEAFASACGLFAAANSFRSQCDENSATQPSSFLGLASAAWDLPGGAGTFRCSFHGAASRERSGFFPQELASEPAPEASDSDTLGPGHGTRRPRLPGEHVKAPPRFAGPARRSERVLGGTEEPLPIGTADGGVCRLRLRGLGLPRSSPFLTMPPRCRWGCQYVFFIVGKESEAGSERRYL